MQNTKAETKNKSICHLLYKTKNIRAEITVRGSFVSWQLIVHMSVSARIQWRHYSGEFSPDRWRAFSTNTGMHPTLRWSLHQKAKSEKKKIKIVPFRRERCWKALSRFRTKRWADGHLRTVEKNVRGRHGGSSASACSEGLVHFPACTTDLTRTNSHFEH